MVEYSQSFRGARLRLALALLLVTGVRIRELLPLRLNQIETLFTKG
jgi:integrase